MEPLGVKPEATRVALHRLRKDGWIVSQRCGREVTYQLSENGRRDTKAVYDDVYGQDQKYPQGWQFLILGDIQDDLNDELPSIRIGRHLALMPRSSNRDPSSTIEIQIVGDDIPIWFQNRLLSSEILSLSEKLLAHIHLYKNIDSRATDLQKTLIRLLILHHWRRMALRPASWAHISLLPDGPVSSFQKAVTGFLKQTPATKIGR